MKKVVTLLIVILVAVGIYKMLVMISDMVPKKDPIKTAQESVGNAYGIIADSYVKSAEEYCQMALVKGEPRIERVTDPKEVKTRSEDPKEVDLTFSQNCKVTGKITYKKTVFEYQNSVRISK